MEKLKHTVKFIDKFYIVTTLASYFLSKTIFVIAILYFYNNTVQNRYY